MERTEKLVVTFRNTTGAIAMEKNCRARGIPGRLIPVPRSISASCGLCWVCGREEEERLRDFVRDSGLETEGYHYLELP